MILVSTALASSEISDKPVHTKPKLRSNIRPLAHLETSTWSFEP